MFNYEDYGTLLPIVLQIETIMSRWTRTIELTITVQLKDLFRFL